MLQELYEERMKVYDEMVHNSIFHDKMHGDLEIFIDTDHNLTIMDRYTYMILDETEVEWMLKALLKEKYYEVL